MEMLSRFWNIIWDIIKIFIQPLFITIMASPNYHALMIVALIGLIGWLLYRWIREYIVLEHMRLFIIICAVVSAIMLYWAYVDKRPAWLYAVGFVALLVVLVIFVWINENVPRKIVAQYMGSYDSEESYTTDASAKIRFEKVGNGYEGKVVDYTPSKTRSYTIHHYLYSLPNGKKIHVKMGRYLGGSTRISTSSLYGEYGILTYKFANRIYGEEFNDIVSFVQYEDQEEGKAIFESKNENNRT